MVYRIRASHTEKSHSVTFMTGLKDGQRLVSTTVMVFLAFQVIGNMNLPMNWGHF